MKILLLDVDGVLITPATLSRLGSGKLEPALVARLQSVVGAVPDLRVILHSAWNARGLVAFNRALSEAGWTLDPVVFTTGTNHKPPIDTWARKSYPQGKVVLLQDDGPREPLKTVIWVQTLWATGLTEEVAATLLKVLSE